MLPTLTLIGRVESPLLDPASADGLRDLEAGAETLVLTCLHRVDRNLCVDRPNPIALHRVTIDSTPIVDVNPVLDER